MICENLWFWQDLTVPSGILFTLVVAMTTLAVYGLQLATGFWPQGDLGNYENYYAWVKGSWLFIELAMLVVEFSILTAFPRFICEAVNRVTLGH